MYVNLAQGGCIGCGACASMCPNLFKLDKDGRAYAINTPVPKAEESCARKAEKMCPVDVIFCEEDDH